LAIAFQYQRHIGLEFRRKWRSLKAVQWPSDSSYSSFTTLMWRKSEPQSMLRKVRRRKICLKKWLLSSW
jgi:hypothetical protein